MFVLDIMLQEMCVLQKYAKDKTMWGWKSLGEIPWASH